MRLSTFGLTDKGRVRSRNEDNLLVDDFNHVYAVADGLGGLPRGSLASNLAIHHLEEAINTKEFANGKMDYQELFSSINEKVYAEGVKVSEEIGIGTTLTVAKVDGAQIEVGHVGDCALFHFRGDEWTQWTTDHTMEQEIRSRLQPGENAYIPEYFAHTLTRCIGQQGKIKPDTFEHTVEGGDRLVICSDGVTKTMTAEELLEQVKEAKTPESYVRQVIDIGNERGGPDNITAIALFFE